MTLVAVLLCALMVMVPLVTAQEPTRKPLYKYRYETEDLMKTAASSVPVHGYHLVEGGYYPEPRFNTFGGPGAGNLGGTFGPARFGMGGGQLGMHQPAQFIAPPLGGQGYIGGHMGGQGYIGGQGGLGHMGHAHHPIGGEYQDHTVYQDGKKQQNDAVYKKASSSEQQEGKKDQEGFQRGEAQVRNDKGDTASYSGEQGQKKASEDGKNYNGNQHYNQQGKAADEQNQKQGHKKGHVIKGFKTSHHKDETGRTEEYYDESNDEGGNSNFKGTSGAFGEQAQNTYKGGHENGQFNADQSKKQGHVENIHVQDNANADKGDYANRQSYGQGQTHGVNNGVDQQSLLGHQESSRFFKQHPYHVPFYKA